MLYRILAIIMVGIFSAESQAQNSTDTLTNAKRSKSGISATRSIDEVIVYGDRSGGNYRSTAPVYSITQGTLDRLGVTDISSALSRLPGVTLKDYGGAGGLKTVSVRGFGAQHTNVIYDGAAISNHRSGSIDVSRYSMDNVSDISLVIGDNEDIFQPARSVASAATLHINTMKMPTSDLATHLTAQMKAGSWGYVAPHFRIDKNLSKKFGVSLVADFLHADNNYPYKIKNVDHWESSTRNNSRMNSGTAELNMAYHPSEKNLLTLKGYYYHNDRRLPGMVHYYVNDSRQSMKDENAFGQFNWTSTLSQRLRLNYMAKFNYDMTDFKDPAYPGGVKDHRYWQREYYTSACLLYKFSENLSVDYSADYSFNNLTGGDVSTYRSPRRNTILQTAAAKFQTSRWTVIGRLIASIYKDKTNIGESAKDISHLSPSLSLNYKVLSKEDLYVRLSYKDIFRAPSFSELYYEHFGSTDLNPERTNQVNLGVTWTHSYSQASRFSITADTYVNKVKDKIVSIPYDMFKWTNVNLGSVHSHGIDITAHVNHQLSKEHMLIMSGNYTLQKVRDRTGGKESRYYDYQVAYTPEYSGGASLAWENPWVNISGNAILSSSRWPNNEHYQGTMLPGYSNIGITLYRDITVRKCQFHLRFDIKNILNEQYEIVGNYPMPGRSWMATARMKL